MDTLAETDCIYQLVVQLMPINAHVCSITYYVLYLTAMLLVVSKSEIADLISVVHIYVVVSHALSTFWKHIIMSN